MQLSHFIPMSRVSSLTNNPYILHLAVETAATPTPLTSYPAGRLTPKEGQKLLCCKQNLSVRVTQPQFSIICIVALFAALLDARYETRYLVTREFSYWRSLRRINQK